MFFLLVITALCFVSVHSTLLGNLILKWLNKPTSKEIELLAQKDSLKKLQKTLSITDDFAKYSKLQRQINKIDEDLTESKNEKSGLMVHFGVTYGLKIAFGMVLICLSIYYRSSPIFVLNRNVDLMPFRYLITYPHEVNEVSLHFWILCCTTTARLINV